jgi:hypothetical protein
MEEEYTRMWSEPIKISSLTERELRYPLIVTPVGTGLRFFTDNKGTPRCISGDPMPSTYVREKIEEYGMDGLDGHIQVVGGACPVDAVVGLAEKEEPDFEFFVQDVSGTGLKYRERCDLAKVLPTPRPDWLKLAQSAEVFNAVGAEDYWRAAGRAGSAGIYLRTGGCMYTEGSMPWTFMTHIEYAKWKKGVATAVGFTGTGVTLDYITCMASDMSGPSFNIEHGFTPKQRKDIWRDRQVYNKFIVRYEYQELGTSVPLNPRFKKISKR